MRFAVVGVTERIDRFDQFRWTFVYFGNVLFLGQHMVLFTFCVYVTENYVCNVKVYIFNHVKLGFFLFIFL